jgi:hypothetical protein
MTAGDPRTTDSNLPAGGRDLYDALAAVAHHLLHLITLGNYSDPLYWLPK